MFLASRPGFLVVTVGAFIFLAGLCVAAWCHPSDPDLHEHRTRLGDE